MWWDLHLYSISSIRWNASSLILRNWDFIACYNAYLQKKTHIQPNWRLLLVPNSQLYFILFQGIWFFSTNFSNYSVHLKYSMHLHELTECIYKHICSRWAHCLCADNRTFILKIVALSNLLNCSKSSNFSFVSLENVCQQKFLFLCVSLNLFLFLFNWASPEIRRKSFCSIVYVWIWWLRSSHAYAMSSISIKNSCYGQQHCKYGASTRLWKKKDVHEFRPQLNLTTYNSSMGRLFSWFGPFQMTNRRFAWSV